MPVGSENSMTGPSSCVGRTIRKATDAECGLEARLEREGALQRVGVAIGECMRGVAEHNMATGASEGKPWLKLPPDEYSGGGVRKPRAAQ